jgi:hypothetical protein
MKNKVIGELVWKSEQEQIKEVEEIKKTRDKDYGQDGKIVVAEGKFVYRGIAYLIKVLRYFNYRNGFTTMGRDRISDHHAVVEVPDETQPIIDLIPRDYESEFLYHDTLHSWNDKQTTEQQIKVCHDWAKKDIDNLLDGEISKRIEEGIKTLQEAKDELDKKAKEIKR